MRKREKSHILNSPGPILISCQAVGHTNDRRSIAALRGSALGSAGQRGMKSVGPVATPWMQRSGPSGQPTGGELTAGLRGE